MNTQLQQPINSLCWATGTSNWYFCSNEDFNQIKKSTNDGVTWNPMALSIGTDQVMSMDVIKQGENVFGYAVTINGRILRLVDSVSVIGIHNNNIEIPDHYSLLQNYPNPFNPETQIRFDIPKNDFVNLSVFDSKGQLVKILVNEIVSAGKYSKEFNSAGLSSGVYFYKLSTEGFTATKKMILVK